jgi:DNA-binding PadR family transcriptional regulator
MENKILNALLEKDYSFNELFQYISCNRNSLLKNLNKLLTKNLIHLTPEGQKHWYSLTEKGQEKATRLACDNINQGLKSLKLLSSNLNPKKVKDNFSAELNTVDWDIIKKRDSENWSKKPDLVGITDIDNDNMRIWEENKNTKHPLFFPISEAPVVKALSDICQSLHKIRSGIYTNNSDGKNYVTLINSNGVYLFPEKNLEGLNPELLALLPFSKAQQYSRPSK